MRELNVALNMLGGFESLHRTTLGRGWRFPRESWRGLLSENGHKHKGRKHVSGNARVSCMQNRSRKRVQWLLQSQR